VDELERMVQVLADQPKVSFALLIGSRINSSARATSDWDVAVWIPRELPALARFEVLESVRCRLADVLCVSPVRVDVIDLAHAGLAMRAVAADEGVLLKQDSGSLYNRFLNRTWRETEEFNREARRAA
jgi:uncharacterized protein